MPKGLFSHVSMNEGGTIWEGNLEAFCNQSNCFNCRYYNYMKREVIYEKDNLPVRISTAKEFEWIAYLQTWKYLPPINLCHLGNQRIPMANHKGPRNEFWI